MFARLLLTICLLAVSSLARAQPFGPPDRGEPGDEMIQAYLAQEAAKLSHKFDADVKSLADWQAKRSQYLEEYYYMLGLSPWPDKTPLNATVTRMTSQTAGDYIVEMVHYQSMPGLYVTGNLYRPANIKPGEKLPAVFYVCGHSGRGRDGNKVAYQSHGIWFARHRYVCLVVDTLQLGEIAAIHHGTYRENRWWWHSRGYTPAGVEAWNGVRGIDYLVSRADVDPQRLAVTGISGGGAATFWVAAADERVKVAVPVSGMADLESYVNNRVINGHCDCMFLYNTFQWPWTRIAGLVAPRPMLFVNSDNDRIFPMDANERIIARLERLYSLYGASDRVDSVVSVGGHAYREDIRQAAYRFINAHLKGDARPIADSEIDIVSEGRDPGPYPIPPEKLRVFPTDADIPRDQRNTTIDESFVPTAKPEIPTAAEFASWKQRLVAELRRVSFSHFPDTIPPAKETNVATSRMAGGPLEYRLETEPPIECLLRVESLRPNSAKVLLIVLNEDDGLAVPDWAKELATDDTAIGLLQPRGTGRMRWTTKNPPNYVLRSHALLGRTVDAGRVWDVLATARYLAEPIRGRTAKVVTVAGSGPASAIAAYAAALDDTIVAATLHTPPASHMDKSAPQFLNALRVADIPIVAGLLAPRQLTLIDSPRDAFQATSKLFEVAGSADKLIVK